MAEPIPPAAKRDIRNLMLLLAIGVTAAFLLAGLFLYNYGPSGRYAAQNVLLDPKLLTDLGSKKNLTFKSIEFNFYDDSKKEWKKLNIDINQYAKFYQLVANEKSLEDVSADVKSLFSSGKPATINIFVKSDGVDKVFQEIVFAPQGNYFRVELRDQSAKEQWAIFHYPQIYQTVHNLFIP